MITATGDQAQPIIQKCPKYQLTKEGHIIMEDHPGQDKENRIRPVITTWRMDTPTSKRVKLVPPSKIKYWGSGTNITEYQIYQITKN